MELLFKCQIDGRCYIKKNQKRIFGRGKRKVIVYTPEFRQWESRALSVILIQKKIFGIYEPIDYFVHAKYTFSFENHLSEADLSNLFEGPSDLLEKSGVIKNDKLIHSYDGSRKLFGQRSGLLVELFKFIE